MSSQLTANAYLQLVPHLDDLIVAAGEAQERADYVHAEALYEQLIGLVEAASLELRSLPAAPGRAAEITDAASLSAADSLFRWRQPPRSENRQAPPEVSNRQLLLAEKLRFLAIAQQKAGQFENAAISLEGAVGLFDDVLGPVNTESATCYYLAGLLNLQSASRKESYYRRALQIYEQLDEPANAGRITSCLSGLGYWLAEQNRSEQSCSVLEAAIESLRKHSEPVPLLLQLAIGKSVKGSQLLRQLQLVCRATGRKLADLPGLPSLPKQILSLGLSVAFFWFVMGSGLEAVYFLLLLFVHEMGHYAAAGQVGVAVSRPVFTPLGAFITLLSQPASAKEEAYFAFAGPLMGTIGAFVALSIGIACGSYELCGAAKYAFVLNLFNLIPLAPMDGGRISMAISRRMWILGALLFAVVGWAIIYYTLFPPLGSDPAALSQRWSLFPLKVFLIYYMMRNGWKDLRERKRLAASRPEYFQLTWPVRLAYTASYLALGAVLIFTLGILLDDDGQLPAPPGH